VIYTQRQIVDIKYQLYKKKEIKTFKVIFDDTIEYDYKYLDRTAIEKLYSQKEDCDEIIIVKNGLLTDTSIANICLQQNGTWHTPKKPLLLGTQRAKLLDQDKLIQTDLTLNDLKKAEKIALCNAMIGFDPLLTYTLYD
jgi:4-amino-4-deoxychorismate lyase